MTEKEVKEFYRRLGLNAPSPLVQLPVERPQVVNAENPQIQYVIRLSGDTQPLDQRAIYNA